MSTSSTYKTKIDQYVEKKSLKIPKGQSETVYRRRTDKQRSTKHAHKTKDLATQTPLKTGMNSGALEG